MVILSYTITLHDYHFHWGWLWLYEWLYEGLCYGTSSSGWFTALLAIHRVLLQHCINLKTTHRHLISWSLLYLYNICTNYIHHHLIMTTHTRSSGRMLNVCPKTLEMVMDQNLPTSAAWCIHTHFSARVSILFFHSRSRSIVFFLGGEKNQNDAAGKIERDLNHELW